MAPCRVNRPQSPPPQPAPHSGTLEAPQRARRAGRPSCSALSCRRTPRDGHGTNHRHRGHTGVGRPSEMDISCSEIPFDDAPGHPQRHRRAARDAWGGRSAMIRGWDCALASDYNRPYYSTLYSSRLVRERGSMRGKQPPRGLASAARAGSRALWPGDPRPRVSCWPLGSPSTRRRAIRARWSRQGCLQLESRAHHSSPRRPCRGTMAAFLAVLALPTCMGGPIVVRIDLWGSVGRSKPLFGDMAQETGMPMRF